MPDSVSTPVPTLVSAPPVPPLIPPSCMKPENAVERLLLPTVRLFEPRKMLPAPAIEPALSLWSLLGPVLDEKSTLPLLALVKWTSPLLWVMVGSPAVLAEMKETVPVLVMAALPAVLVSRNARMLLL